MAYNPARLNKRITIQRQAPIMRDEMGGKQPAKWSNAITVWAAMRHNSALQREYMGDHVSSQAVYFIVREADIAVSSRIMCDGKYYDIVNIEELAGIPKYLEIETKIVKPR